MGKTKKKSKANFVIYRDSSASHYTAVCLDFDIVEHGEDLQQLKESIEAAAKLHLQRVIENKLNRKLLHRYAPEKYWKKLSSQSVFSYRLYLDAV